MNDIDTPHHDLASHLGAMASRVRVDDRLAEAKGELRYAAVTPISRQRRIPMIVGIATLAAASVATVAIIQRPNAREEQSRPPAAASGPDATTQPASTPGLLFDVFPIVDEADLPIVPTELHASFAVRTEESESVSQTFVAGINDASPRFTNTPTDVISITAFRNEEASTIFPTAKPGRRSDVSEMNWGENEVTLVWELDGEAFTMVGSNLDVMYELLDRTSAVSSTGDLAFLVEEPLPGGLVPLNPQVRSGPGVLPTVSDDFRGQFTIEMMDEPALQLLAGRAIERLKVGDYVAWLATSSYRPPVLAIELTTRQTVLISGDGLDREQVIAIGEKIRFVDEATWRAHYNFSEVPTLSAPTTALATEGTEYVPDATEYAPTDTAYTATTAP